MKQQSHAGVNEKYWHFRARNMHNLRKIPIKSVCVCRVPVPSHRGCCAQRNAPPNPRKEKATSVGGNPPFIIHPNNCGQLPLSAQDTFIVQREKHKGLDMAIKLIRHRHTLFIVQN